MRRSSQLAFASWLCLISGVFTVTGWVQHQLFINWVRAPWNVLPWVMLVLGLGAIVAGGRAREGLFPRVFVAFSLSVVLGIISLVWTGFAMMNGFFSLLHLVQLSMVGLASLLLLTVLPMSRRISAAHADMMKEIYGDSGAPEPVASPQPRGGLIIALLAAGLVVSPFLFAFFAPVQFDQGWRRVRMVLGGRMPTAGAMFSTEHVDYPYPWSPWNRYAELESPRDGLDPAALSTWADKVALEVGLRLLVYTGEDDVGAAELALWRSKEEQRIAFWIASALRDEGVFYHVESLLSRSFDPTIHRGRGEVHLDCDQLVHLFEHVAWRLDLDMREVEAPYHVYLQHRAPAALGEERVLTLDTTSFREIEIDETHIDYMGKGIGAGFVIAPDYYSSGAGGSWASPELTEAAGLYQPLDVTQIEDNILGNLAAGLYRDDYPGAGRALLAPRLEGTRSYLIVDNMHRWTVSAARTALNNGDAATAIIEAQAAWDLRQSYAHLVLTTDPVELLILARAQAAAGDIASARLTVEQAMHVYEGLIGGPADGEPVSQTHGELLELRADINQL